MAEALKASQWDESRGCPPSHPYHGGVGPDARSAPDLAHTALFLRALRAAEVPAADPAIRRSLTFVSRCQFSGGEGPDEGGFALVPGDGGPPAGADAAPARRPRGSSTCLGLTSLLAAGVAPDDARVRGALRWLQVHYTLDVHPGMARPREGLYGYYYEFARAMAASGIDRIPDVRGVPHDWRKELTQRLAARRRPDGSWVNPEESPDPAGGGPAMVTGLALLTIRQISE